MVGSRNLSRKTTSLYDQKAFPNGVRFMEVPLHVVYILQLLSALARGNYTVLHLRNLCVYVRLQECMVAKKELINVFTEQYYTLGLLYIVLFDVAAFFTHGRVSEVVVLYRSRYVIKYICVEFDPGRYVVNYGFI